MTLRDLTTLLAEISKQTTFDAGAPSTTNDLTTITFDGKAESSLTPAQLRDYFRQSSWHSDRRQIAESARPRLPEHLADELAKFLRNILGDYIDAPSDRIGHSFPIFGSSATDVTARPDGFVEFRYRSTVSDFAVALIRCTALLGHHQTAILFFTLFDSNQFSYSISSLLVGITTKQRLDTTVGLRAIPLPISSEELPNSLPKERAIPTLDYLGRCMLSIDALVRPAFFRLSDARGVRNELKISSALGDASFYSIYQALSLICNRYVYFKTSWEDYEEVSALVGRSHSGNIRIGSRDPDYRIGLGFRRSFSTGAITLTNVDAHLSVPSISLDDLQKACKMHGDLDSRQRNDRRFRTAVSRWVRAARPDLELADKFIDLRIALEALYLDRNPGEQTFRLATRGAWHLGHEWSERKEIQTALRRFYGVASRVVHGEEPNVAKGDNKLLDQAREMCRRGIMKTIEQKEQPNWDDMVLGRGIE